MNINEGDLIQLGNNKLICADSTDYNVYKKLLEGVKVDLLVTDPPYGVNMQQKSEEILNKKNYSKITNDDLPLHELGEILLKVFLNVKKCLKDDASYYVFSPQGGDMELMMMMMMKKAELKCRHQLIWVKERPVFSMNRLDYDYQHEPILYGWVKKHHFYRRDGKQKSSILKFKQYPNKYHPTSKPPSLIANLIYNNTKPQDTVLDVFGGGGNNITCF